MPEVEDAVPVGAAEKAGSIYDVGLARENGPEQDRVFLRVVLEVGVLDDDEIARRGAYAGPDGRSLPHVLRLKKNAHPRVAGLQFGKKFSRAIRRTVIHTQQFDLKWG